MAPTPGQRPDRRDSDEGLIRRIVDGDESALGILYDRYGGLVYSVAKHVLGDSGAAEEVLQDIFHQLWRSSAQLRLRTWKPLKLAAGDGSQSFDRPRSPPHSTIRRRGCGFTRGAVARHRERGGTERDGGAGSSGLAGSARGAARGHGACLFRRTHSKRNRAAHRRSVGNGEDAPQVCARFAKDSV